MNNVISVIIKRKNEYKRTGKTASSEREENAREPERNQQQERKRINRSGRKIKNKSAGERESSRGGGSLEKRYKNKEKWRNVEGERGELWEEG